MSLVKLRASGLTAFSLKGELSESWRVWFWARWRVHRIFFSTWTAVKTFFILGFWKIDGIIIVDITKARIIMQEEKRTF